MAKWTSTYRIKTMGQELIISIEVESISKFDARIKGLAGIQEVVKQYPKAAYEHISTEEVQHG